MKWYFLAIVGLLLVASTSFVDGKSKKSVLTSSSTKFEGDFEFVDEESTDSGTNSQQKSSTLSEKKKWIHDPSSDLCKPLNCKKKELCLLEDAYTAVCVSKKELHKNRDEVVSKTKYLEQEAKKTAELEDNDELQVQDEESDEDGTSDDDDDDDDVFYDSDSDNDMDEEPCKPCPVIKPTFLCGSDNKTYSSLCRLDYHNCIHTTLIKIGCKGFCPCKDTNESTKKQIRLSDRTNAFNAKYQRTLNDPTNKLNDNDIKRQLNNNLNTEYKPRAEDILYDNKHYKYIKYTTYNNNNNVGSGKEVTTESNIIPTGRIGEDKHRRRDYNDALDKPNPNKYKGNRIDNKYQKALECKGTQLTNIGNRLLDWFSVIMADLKKRHTHTEKSKARFPLTCKMEAKWMFGHLDLNNDGLLSTQEMYDLEHDQNEKCIKPFIDTCDVDKDLSITPREWCKCFEKTDRPCAAVRRRLTGNLVGTYAPDCDVQGFYKPMQCHISVGMCWCVDSHGVEYSNTRTRGKPNCDDAINNANSSNINEDDTEDNDDEDSEDDDSTEGSADRLLIF